MIRARLKHVKVKLSPHSPAERHSLEQKAVFDHLGRGMLRRHPGIQPHPSGQKGKFIQPLRCQETNQAPAPLAKEHRFDIRVSKAWSLRQPSKPQATMTQKDMLMYLSSRPSNSNNII